MHLFPLLAAAAISDTYFVVAHFSFYVTCIAYFFGGAFFVNAIPHFVSGLTGHPFPSPFAKPPGKGLSSPVVNVLWGAFNFAIAYLLIFRVGAFDIRNTTHILLVAAGGLVMGIQLASWFGRANTTSS
jgi:hypothetical protein